MYLIDLTVKRLSYFSGFQSLSLGFASINDDNINFVFLREVIQSPYNFLTVLSICSWFKHPCLFRNQTPWKDLQCSELPVHVMDSLAVKLFLNYAPFPCCKHISLESYQEVADVQYEKFILPNF